MPQVRESGTHNSVVHAFVGSQLFEQGETEQALSLASQFDGDDQIDYYALLALAIWMSDRNEIIRLFENIPDSKKSATALSTLRQGLDYLFSYYEIAQLKEYLNAQDKETWEQHFQEQK